MQIFKFSRARLRCSEQRSCSRKGIFFWSFSLFILSLLAVNVSFAKGYRSMTGFGTFVYSAVNSRNVLELRQYKSPDWIDAEGTGRQPMEMSSQDKSDANPPANATTPGARGTQTQDATSSQSESAAPGAKGGDVTLASDGGNIKGKQADSKVAAAPPPPPQRRGSTGTTLVVYVFQNRDAASVDNLQYFLRNGLEGGEGVDYVLVLQQLQKKPFVPSGLPEGVVVESYDGCSSPWGVYGWALERHNAPSYQRYVLLTSAVQGPMLPAHTKVSWVDALTSLVRGDVRMAGPVISCQAVALGGEVGAEWGEWRVNPHVTQEAVVVDRDALAAIRAAGEVLRCYDNPFDAKFYGESGAAKAVLDAGYGLDSLMLRYQGVDWRDKANWGCNGGVRPTAGLVYDGVALNPLEVMFLEVTPGWLASEHPGVRLARKYAEWQAPGMDVKASEWVSSHWELKAPRLAVMHVRGPGCFDSHYYAGRNPDVAGGNRLPWELWEHFLTNGQFEGRDHRFSCDMVVGQTYKQAYFKHRGPACFDFRHYHDSSPDLASIQGNDALWEHFIALGQFEPRPFRFSCDTDFMLAGQQRPPGGLQFSYTPAPSQKPAAS